ncbi:MAG: DUF58 domain-containing protein [Candidatus Aenigmarchaeota archaeon]|nr:DUF58 domain-containing protein [Candidatus Aenigmarchaeota archaeon]
MPIDPSFLKELDKFRIAIKRRVHSNLKGSRESTATGEGLVFEDYVPYTPGDDIRHIDWNVFARTEKTFIKRMEEEKNSIVHIVLDASSSMNFGNNIKKFEYGAMIGLGFAYMAAKANEKFEFTVFSNKLDFIRAKAGSRGIMGLVEQLNKADIGGKSKLKESLLEYKKNIHSRSIVVIISDFLYDINDIREVLLRYKRSQAYLVQILDPVEKNLKLSGDVILKDLETDTSMQTYISARTREQYRQRLQEHIMRIDDICSHLGAKFISMTTDQPVFDSFYRILFN